MRNALIVLLASNLLLGAWIAWGDPEDGSHEPGRLERQVQPGRLRVIGEEELQRARRRSLEAQEPSSPQAAGVPAAKAPAAATAKKPEGN